MPEQEVSNVHIVEGPLQQEHSQVAHEVGLVLQSLNQLEQVQE